MCSVAGGQSIVPNDKSIEILENPVSNFTSISEF